MNNTIAPAQYLQIALDLAARISDGELPEGSRLYGRSVMASEYGVSPETIRRSLHLLADMKVVEVKPQSGAVILSADNARRYISNFKESTETQTIREQLRDVLGQYHTMNRKLSELVGALIQSAGTFQAAREPLPNYQVTVPADSPLIGQSLGNLKFWQSTGGTVVAIRRGQAVILSPGPYAELYGGDTIILVGSPEAAAAAQRFISKKEEPHDLL